MGYLHDVGASIRHAIDNTLGLAANGQSQYEDAKATAIQQAREQRDWEEYMADKQYYRSTPAAQMQMYREAGLNPSLMYGQMTDLQTTIPSGAEANVPSPSSGRLDSLLGLGADLAILPAKIDNIKANTDYLNSQSGVNSERVKTLQYQNAMLKFQKEAYDQAAREGLIEKAVRAGFNQEINESDESTYRVLEQAWNFLIYTGLADNKAISSNGEYVAGNSQDAWLRFDPDALEKARSEFVGSQESKIASYDTIKEMQKYQRLSFKSDNEFQSFLMEHKDEWWSKVIRGAKWILKEYGLPSFSVSSETGMKYTGNGNFKPRQKKSFSFGK